jgi:hypothetical protein
MILDLCSGIWYCASRQGMLFFSGVQMRAKALTVAVVAALLNFVFQLYVSLRLVHG